MNVVVIKFGIVDELLKIVIVLKDVDVSLKFMFEGEYV